MSCADFQKYLTKNPITVPDSPQTRKLIIILDSKGGYLKSLPADSTVEPRIEYNYSGGRTTSQEAGIVSFNIDNYVPQYGKFF